MSKQVTREHIRTILGRVGRRPRNDRIGRYRAEDVELLFTWVAELRRDQLNRFLGENGLVKSGNKREIITRLKKALDDQEIGLSDLIGLLDAVQPWGKQHIFLLQSANADPTKWRHRDAALAHLQNHGLDGLLRSHAALLLPDKLKLASIELSSARLRVTAVERRIGYERIEELDDEETSPDGELVEYRAFVQRTTRGLIAFDWDLMANDSFLQVTQLPMHQSYEHAQGRFADLVQPWLDISAFSSLRLQAAITSFHEREKAGTLAVRSQRVEFEALDGRRLAGTSKAATQPLFGNVDIDDALETVRSNGALGHIGNFFLRSDPSDPHNAIEPGEDVHIMLLGNKDRINIMTPQREDVVRYAIRRVREAC